jgi:hypothetical protein
VKACAAPSREEEDIRAAEFIAACQKCGLKERCEKNKQQNLYGEHARDFLVGKFTIAELTADQLRIAEAKAREEAARPVMFACGE